MQYKERTGKNGVPLVTTYHPALRKFNSILAYSYTNGRMTDLFKDPPMTTLKRRKSVRDMVVRGNPFPNGGFKTCSDARCLLCKHSTNTVSFASLIMCLAYKILGNTSCRTENCIYLISVRFDLNITLRKQMSSAEKSTQKQKKKDPAGNISISEVTNGKK